jgi:hypothetical protein
VLQAGASDTKETAGQQGFIRVGFFANEASYRVRGREAANLTGEAAEVERKALKAMGRS